MQESEKLFEIASDIWQSRMTEGNFHDAILVGMSTYILLRMQNDEKLSPGALNLVHVAIETTDRTSGKQGLSDDMSCSFCGRREPEIKLAAGPNAFICNMCVEALAGVFNKKA
jgi:hypothetical protein